MMARIVTLSATGAVIALFLAAQPGASQTAVPSAVSHGGITLTSDSITLPDETATLPDSAVLVTGNCLACHSAEMIAAQPVLDAAKWQATIDKMRAIYKAPIDPADDTALIAELTALPTQRPAD